MRLCARGRRRAGRVTNVYTKGPQLANSGFGETVSKATSRPIPQPNTVQMAAATEDATDSRCEDRFDSYVTELRESAYRNDIVDCLTLCGWETTQASLAKLCTAPGLAAQYHHDQCSHRWPRCGMSQAAGMIIDRRKTHARGRFQ
jgi:hypothetical protein